MFEQNVGAQPAFVSWKDKLHGEAPKPNFLSFSSEWPKDWLRGKSFQIKKSVVVSFARSFDITGDDYKNLDFSNASGGLNLYPESEGYVHEILVGFKKGNYVAQIEIPSSKYLATLPQSSMIPSATDDILRYLNAKFPEDSPWESPNIKLWVVKDAAAFVFRLLTLEGIDYERCSVKFIVAKHKIEQLPTPPSVSTPIPYHTELASLG